MAKRKKHGAARHRETQPAPPLRTIALVGHRSSGKTTLAEAMLALGGAVRTPGSVEDGTALLDHDPEERRRRQSLFNGYGWIEWQGTVIQIIDAPGHEARAGERRLAIQAADAVVVVVDAGASLAIGAENALLEAERAGLPCFVFVNKLDRPHDFGGLIESLQVGERPAVCLDAPISEGGRCAGVFCLLEGTAHALEPGFEPPSRRFLGPFVESLHEAVAVTDDGLIADFLEHGELTRAQLDAGLTQAIGRGAFHAVLFGSALRAYGVQRLLNQVVARAPDALSRRGPLALEYDGTPVRIEGEGSFVAQLVSAHLNEDGSVWRVLRVFRGQAPINSSWTHGDTGASAKVRKLYRLRGARRAAAPHMGPGALVATWDPLPGRPGDTFTSGEQLVVSTMERPGRMMTLAFEATPAHCDAWNQIATLDGAVSVKACPELGQVHVSGISDAHLDLHLDLMRTRLDLAVSATLPPVIYREMPRGSVQGVQGEHKVDDGDGLPIEYGACILDLTPGEDGEFSVRDTYEDLEELPRRFRGPIEDGVREACEHGPSGGYPVTGVHLVLTGGDYDMLQSTPDHFRLAGAAGTRKALQCVGTRLLEPWWKVDVYVPSTVVGETISEVSGRRGRVMGMDVLGAETRVVVRMPYRELRTFSRGLQAASQGRGRFFADFSHHETAPDHLVHEAVEHSPFRTARPV